MYVDVDDTLVRSVGAKRIPIPATIEHVRELAREGVDLYLWSRGGADYARSTAEELGITECFTAFLPKPNVIIDDENIVAWRDFLEVHPSTCRAVTAAEYRKRLAGA
jgi:hypothetical protein